MFFKLIIKIKKNLNLNINYYNKIKPLALNKDM